eukprot:6183305-Pleurochrysis_carterae.AAC.1
MSIVPYSFDDDYYTYNTNDPVPYQRFRAFASTAAPVDPIPVTLTFSSWNIPLLGPTPADAMNEMLLSDDGSQIAEISIYYTNDFNSPTTISSGFSVYNAGSNNVAGYSYPIFNQYGTPFGDGVNTLPWVGKYGGSGMTHPDDATNTLTGMETGDISSHAPVSGGLVIRFKVPVSGSWEIHDTFLLPTNRSLVALNIVVRSEGDNTTVEPRQSWDNATTTINSESYVQSYADTRTIVNSRGSGVDLGILTKDDYVYFVVDNFNGWGGDGSLLRFRMTCAA